MYIFGGPGQCPGRPSGLFHHHLRPFRSTPLPHSITPSWQHLLFTTAPSNVSWFRQGLLVLDHERFLHQRWIDASLGGVHHEPLLKKTPNQSFTIKHHSRGRQQRKGVHLCSNGSVASSTWSQNGVVYLSPSHRRAWKISDGRCPHPSNSIFTTFLVRVGYFARRGRPWNLAHRTAKRPHLPSSPWFFSFHDLLGLSYIQCRKSRRGRDRSGDWWSTRRDQRCEKPRRVWDFFVGFGPRANLGQHVGTNRDRKKWHHESQCTLLHCSSRNRGVQCFVGEIKISRLWIVHAHQFKGIGWYENRCWNQWE